MKRYRLPTRKQCFEIIRQYRVPQHIVRHSLAVSRLGVFLAQRLRRNKVPVNVELVEAACLLHDVARVCDFEKLDYSAFDQTVTEQDKAKWRQIRGDYKQMCHEDAAYDILKAKYPKLALTIKRHRYMAMADEETRPSTWEEKLLYYADMRVMQDRIVPLNVRLTDGHKRNVHLHGSKVQSKINTGKVDPLIYELEGQVCSQIGVNPLELTDEFIDSYPGGPEKQETLS